MEASFVLRGEAVFVGDETRAADVVVRDGRIAAVAGHGEGPGELPLVEAGAALVTPGVVDTHVHLNDPGRAIWEGFETGTRAAAAGGITTLVDMPLNCIPVTTSLAALEAKLAATGGRLHVDLGFWGGVVPGNAGELAGMVAAGALGFKAFMCHSGIDDFPGSDREVLRTAMVELKRLGVPLLVHAELEAYMKPGTAGVRSYHDYLATRPPAMETEAIATIIELVRETGCRAHIVHLSAADALGRIAAAKAEGLPLSVETCPHYLVFAAETIPDGATQFKCAPPIREGANRERLWAGLADGTIDFVACDHSPCTPDLKLMEAGDFDQAWGGIAGVQFALPVVWTHARRRGFGLAEVMRWICGRTSSFARLDGKKGAIAPGLDADFALWHPDQRFDVGAGAIHHRYPITPYAAMALDGVVERTYLRGQLVFDRGQFPAGPIGQPLRPHPAIRG